MAVALYTTYYIYLTSTAEYEAAIASYGDFFDGTPAAAAAIYGMPFPPLGGGPVVGFRGIRFTHPGAHGEEVGFPLPTGTFYDGNVQDAFVPYTGSFPAGVAQDGYVHWTGVFIPSYGVQGDIVYPSAMMQRRWIDGFESPSGTGGSGEGGVLTNSGPYARAASRTSEGMGYAYRSGGTQTRSHTVIEFGASATQLSWERFYMRLVRAPTGFQEQIYGTNSSGEPSDQAVNLYVTPSGALVAYNQGNVAAPGQLLGTIHTMVPGTWYRYDLLITYTDGALRDGTLSVYVNGVFVNTWTATGGVGLDRNQNHTGSVFGQRFSSGDFGLEIDIDDWMNAELPAVLTGVDWVNGSHIMYEPPVALGAGSSVNWVGDWRTLIQNPAMGGTAASSVDASVASSILEVQVRATNRQVGPAAALIMSYMAAGGGGATATLGYNLAGAGFVTSAGLSLTTSAWNRFMYRPTGLLEPVAIDPMLVRLTKDGAAAARRVRELSTVVEYIGVWGPEDFGAEPAQEIPMPTRWIHNSPFLDLVTNTAPLPPVTSVVYQSGTYVGNDLGQDIATEYPPNLIFIRPLSGTTQGAKWMAPADATHRGAEQRLVSDLMPQAFATVIPAAAGFRVASAAADSNDNPIVYQWVAISDIGGRFFHGGAFSHQTTPSPATNPLIDTTFLPLAAFFFMESVEGSNTRGVWYKGVGHAAAAASPLNTSEEAAAATFSLGAIASQSTLHTPLTGNLLQTAYMAMRLVDGSTCGAGVDKPVAAITSYVGDGTGARNIALLLGGRFPLWALVVPHNAQGIFRDPSHTGANSSPFPSGTTIATGITAGIADQITVGSTLNALGVTYDVFVLPGSATAWENTTYAPVVPCAAGGSQWVTNPTGGGATTACTQTI